MIIKVKAFINIYNGKGVGAILVGFKTPIEAEMIARNYVDRTGAGREILAVAVPTDLEITVPDTIPADDPLGQKSN